MNKTVMGLTTKGSPSEFNRVIREAGGGNHKATIRQIGEICKGLVNAVGNGSARPATAG